MRARHNQCKTSRVDQILVSLVFTFFSLYSAAETTSNQEKLQPARKSQRQHLTISNWNSKCLSTYKKETAEKNRYINTSLKRYLRRTINANIKSLTENQSEVASLIIESSNSKKLDIVCKAAAFTHISQDPSTNQLQAEFSTTKSGKPLLTVYISKYDELSEIPKTYFNRVNDAEFEEQFFTAFLNFVDVKLPDQTPTVEPAPLPFKICSFNIQFLGSSKLRKNTALAELMKTSACDMVAIQELIAPPDLTQIPNNPYYGKSTAPPYPDGKPFVPNPLNTDFFLKMQGAGFDSFWLSEQDSGTAEKNQNNGSATEWWVVFYKSHVVKPKPELPNGFLSADVTKNEFYDRVPYAFPFVTTDGKFDFILINVHLHPGALRADRERRKVELGAIYNWISAISTATKERDFIILGDMNLEDEREYLDVTPKPYVSLNTNARYMTNTNLRGLKPYDHVMLSTDTTTEVQNENNFEVINLHEKMKPFWQGSTETYPGLAEAYNHNNFRFYYSDHHPVAFRVQPHATDDD